MKVSRRKSGRKSLDDLSVDCFSIICFYLEHSDYFRIMQVSKSIHSIMVHPKFQGSRYVTFPIRRIGELEPSSKKFDYVKRANLNGYLPAFEFTESEEIGKINTELFERFRCLQYVCSDQFGPRKGKVDLKMFLLAPTELSKLSQLQELWTSLEVIQSWKEDEYKFLKNLKNLKNLHIMQPQTNTTFAGYKDYWKKAFLPLVQIPNLEKLTICNFPTSNSRLGQYADIPIFPHHNIKVMEFCGMKFRHLDNLLKHKKNLEVLKIKRNDMFYHPRDNELALGHEFLLDLTSETLKSLPSLVHLEIEGYTVDDKLIDRNVLPKLRNLSVYGSSPEVCKKAVTLPGLENLKVCWCPLHKPKKPEFYDFENQTSIVNYGYTYGTPVSHEYRNQINFAVPAGLKSCLGVCDDCLTCRKCDERLRYSMFKQCLKCKRLLCVKEGITSLGCVSISTLKKARGCFYGTNRNRKKRSCLHCISSYCIDCRPDTYDFQCVCCKKVCCLRGVGWNSEKPRFSVDMKCQTCHRLLCKSCVVPSKCVECSVICCGKCSVDVCGGNHLGDSTHRSWSVCSGCATHESCWYCKKSYCNQVCISKCDDKDCDRMICRNGKGEDDPCKKFCWKCNKSFCWECFGNVDLANCKKCRQ